VTYEKDRIPEWYEVENDMFGIPFLRRKMTPEDKNADRLAFIIGLPVVIGIILYFAFH